MKQLTVRIQTRFNKIQHSPDLVQSKSSPMLISDLHTSNSKPETNTVAYSLSFAGPYAVSKGGLEKGSRLMP